MESEGGGRRVEGWKVMSEREVHVETDERVDSSTMFTKVEHQLSS